MRLTVGILGGMGPAATVDLLAKLVVATPAARDEDHLRILVDCDPTVPNRNRALAGTGPSPAPALESMARGLVAAGADFLVIACNAAHHWADAIRAAASVPLISMIDETCSTLPPLTRVGVLAADATRAAGLYETALAARGIEPVVATDAEQTRFMAALYRIKAGDLAVRDEMAALSRALVSRGAQAVIAGCTEVPLVLDTARAGAPLVSATDVLVARTMAYATGAAPLP